MEKFKSRRIIVGVLGAIVTIVYGDIKGINPELVLQYVVTIFGIVVGLIGLEDGIKAFKLDAELQKLLEVLLSPKEDKDKSSYPDR